MPLFIDLCVKAFYDLYFFEGGYEFELIYQT